MKLKQILSILGILSVATVVFLQPMQKFFIKPKMNLSVATVLDKPRKITDFQLTEFTGKEFTNKSLKGKWTLLFFGYPTCPTICPATLQLVKETWDYFPQGKAPVDFIFADLLSGNGGNQLELKKFLANYNQEFRGVTGMSSEMTKLKSQLGIFAKDSGQTTAQGAPIVEHTAALMLVDPHGSLKALITPPFDAATLASDLEMLTS